MERETQKREREREREREIERDRDTERERERQTDRQIRRSAGRAKPEVVLLPHYLQFHLHELNVPFTNSLLCKGFA